MNWSFEAVEDSILHLIIKDREFAILVLNDLNKDLFYDDNYSLMFSIIKEYFLEYKDIPKLELLKSIIAGDEDLESKFDPIEAERIYNEIELDDSERTYLKKEIPLFIKHSKFKDLLLYTSAKVEGTKGSKDLETMMDGFQSNLKDIITFDMDKDLGHNIYDVGKRYMHLRDRAQGGIKPALEDLTMHITGYFPKKVYSYIGESGRGKSVLLANDALEAMKQGFNVVYISLEMEEEDFALRMDQNVSSRDARKLLKEDGTIDYLEKKYKDIKKLMKAGDMYLKEFPTRQASVITIERYLEMLQMYKDFKADIVFIDYMDIMKPVGGFTGKRHEDQGVISQELSSFAKMWEIPVVTAVQANRPNSENRNMPIDESRLADSYDKIRIMDGAFSLNVKRNDDLVDRHYLYIVKNRQGKANIQIPFIMNTITMTVQRDTGDLDDKDFE